MGTFRKNRFSFDLNNRLKGGTNSDRPLLVSEFKREFDLLAALLQTDEVIVVNYAEAQTLITDYNAGTGDGLAAGSHYFISDKADRGILLLAVTSNSFSLEGQGIFLNPDFQDIGTLTGTINGMWYAGGEGTFTNGTIVFWNGLHYEVTDDGAFDTTDPATNVLAYTLLSKSIANGYIEEVDFILYDFANDSITRRIDKRNNDVQLTSISVFQWGNNSVARNTLINEGYYNCINNRGTIQNNTLTDNVTVTSDNTNEGSISSSIFSGSSTYTANFSGVGKLKKCTLSPSYYVTIVFKPTVDHDGKTFNGLGSTFEAELDMDDVAIYAANQLTIPTTLNYVGIFTLRNNGAVTIDKITNLPITHEVNFYVQSGNSKLFDHTAIGAAVADELVSDAAAINTIVGRTNGSDRIGYRRSGNLNVRTLIEKLV